MPLSNAHDEAEFTSLCHLSAPYETNAVDGTQIHSLEASFELAQPFFPTYCSLQTNAFGLDIIAFSFTAVLNISQSLPQSPSGRFSTFTASLAFVLLTACFYQTHPNTTMSFHIADSISAAHKPLSPTPKYCSFICNSSLHTTLALTTTDPLAAVSCALDIRSLVVSITN